MLSAQRQSNGWTGRVFGQLLALKLCGLQIVLPLYERIIDWLSKVWLSKPMALFSGDASEIGGGVRSPLDTGGIGLLWYWNGNWMSRKYSSWVDCWAYPLARQVSTIFNHTETIWIVAFVLNWSEAWVLAQPRPPRVFVDHWVTLGCQVFLCKTGIYLKQELAVVSWYFPGLFFVTWDFIDSGAVT